jgi:hypothetical protein
VLVEYVKAGAPSAAVSTFRGASVWPELAVFVAAVVLSRPRIMNVGLELDAA